jgi:hypothetical protein
MTGSLHEGQHTFSSYLAQMFLERETLRTGFVEKITTHILCSANVFAKLLPFMT